MKKVTLFSLLLIVGVVGSQFLGESIKFWVQLATMFCLSFIMIHFGYELEIDKAHPKQYLWDYFVAGTNTIFPWALCALYFFSVFEIPSWKEAFSLTKGLSPTSAGVIFSMLIAAKLSETWVYQKTRILSIFDDINMILFMIPIKLLMVGLNWQLSIITLTIFLLLGIAWRYLRTWKIPASWPWVMFYAALITLACELLFFVSNSFSDTIPLTLEVILPAFTLGCIIHRPPDYHPHIPNPNIPNQAVEEELSSYVSGIFMLLVGLSMPLIPYHSYEWNLVALHVAWVTLLSNLGKMFPLFCYRDEATLRERLALSIAMFPRGEVGAGVLVVSLGYGFNETALTVAVLSLALNLILTGLFIYTVKKLIEES